MSALYHIAQNDPPSLMTKNEQQQAVNYTSDFHHFISLCLKKSPSDRPNASELLSVSDARWLDVNQSEHLLI